MSALLGEGPAGSDGLVEPVDGQDRVADRGAGSGEGEGALPVVPAGSGSVPRGIGPRPTVDGEGGVLRDVEIEVDGVGVEDDREISAGRIDAGWGEGHLHLTDGDG